MSDSIYGLTRSPFLPIPDVNAYLPTQSMEKAIESMRSSLDAGEGISLLLADIGVGKSLCLRLLERSLHELGATIALANGLHRSVKSLLHHFAFRFRLPYQGTDECELREQLLEFGSNQKNPVMLLIDDVQFMPKFVLDEIGYLSKYDNGRFPIFRVVMTATLSFEERLLGIEYGFLNNRITQRCYLDSFTQQETEKHIRQQTQSARVFSEAGCRKIHKLTDGNPRIVNQLCNCSLILAAKNNLLSVDESLVQTAWNRLLQLPDMNTDIKECGPANVVIEFGSLLEDDDECSVTCQETELDEAEIPMPKTNSAVVSERKEHVYLVRSTPDMLPKYPGFPGDGSVLSNWIGPGHGVPAGQAVPYREAILKLHPIEPQNSVLSIKMTKSDLPMSPSFTKSSSLDVPFEETISVAAFHEAETEHVCEKTTTPSYQELYDQLSEFQMTVRSELETLTMPENKNVRFGACSTPRPKSACKSQSLSGVPEFITHKSTAKNGLDALISLIEPSHRENTRPKKPKPAAVQLNEIF